MKVFTLLAFSLVLGYVNADAQDNDDVGYLPGYIVTKSRDTLRGLVKYRSTSRVLENIRFKETEDAKKKMYAPEDIRAYEAEGKIFHSFKVPGFDAYQFMELVIDGYLRLYRATITIPNSTVIPGSSTGAPGSSGATRVTVIGKNDVSDDYLLKQGERELLDAGLRFKKSVSEYLADNAIISGKIRSGEYKKKDLEEIVRIYNEGKMGN